MEWLQSEVTQNSLNKTMKNDKNKIIKNKFIYKSKTNNGRLI